MRLKVKPVEPHTVLDTVVDQLVQECLAAGTSAGAAGSAREQLRVVDLGGGTGGQAARLARAGHRVSVVDPSPNALAAVSTRANEAGLPNLDALQGDEESLATLFEPGTVDLLLCHGVLEMVDDPSVALDAARTVLKPGGRLSLLVAQRHGAVLRRVVQGHLRQAHQIATSPDGRAGADDPLRHRFTSDEILDLLSRAGLVPVDLRGIGLLADLVPPALADHDRELAADLDRYATEQDSLLDDLAASLHAEAVRPS